MTVSFSLLLHRSSLHSTTPQPGDSTERFRPLAKPFKPSNHPTTEERFFLHQYGYTHDIDRRFLFDNKFGMSRSIKLPASHHKYRNFCQVFPNLMEYSPYPSHAGNIPSFVAQFLTTKTRPTSSK